MLHGLVDGFFNLTLVAYTLFWFPIEQVALRFLLWNSILSQSYTLLLIVLQWRFSWVAGYTLSLVLYFVVQLAGKGDLLGSPREVSWLSTEQKVMYSRMAASQRLLANTANAGALWRRRQVGHIFEPTFARSRSCLTLRQSFLTRYYAQLLLVFVLSLLHTISSGVVFASYLFRGRYQYDIGILRTAFGLFLLAVPVGFITYKFPPTSCKCACHLWCTTARVALIDPHLPVYMLVAFAMAASILQIFGLLGYHTSYIFQFLLQSYALVPPRKFPCSAYNDV